LNTAGRRKADCRRVRMDERLLSLPDSNPGKLGLTGSQFSADWCGPSGTWGDVGTTAHAPVGTRAESDRRRARRGPGRADRGLQVGRPPPVVMRLISRSSPACFVASRRLHAGLAAWTKHLQLATARRSKWVQLRPTAAS